MSLIHFLLFTSFVISSHPGYSMKIVITPDNYDGIIPTAFNIVCIPEVTGNCVRKILAIQVAKNGSRPLATLQHYSKVSYNPLLRSSVQAEGVINTGAANSKLTVTFSDVVKQDSGVYTCTSIYLDEWGHLQQDVASHNFTVKDHDIHDIVRYLVGKLASMETLVHTLKSQLAEQESDIGKLDNRTTVYRNEVSSKFDELMDSDRNQTKVIDALNDKVSSNVNALMAADRNQSKMIEALTDKDSFSSAFRAGYNSKDKLVTGNTLVFSVPFLDVGNDYNTTTGIFTAPKKGLYVFDLSVKAYGSNWQIVADLKANGVTVASVYAHDSVTWDQSSVSTIVSLQAGDQVRPVVRYYGGNDYLDYRNRYAIFSGYLLKMT